MKLAILFIFVLFIMEFKGMEIPVGHIIPHSHCDPGWIKTYEKYYKEDVEKILTNVMTHLHMDSRKRFIWADISFWILWWKDQPEDMKRLVKSFIEKGQLEVFIYENKQIVCKWRLGYRR
jgi:hypothetical protein